MTSIEEPGVRPTYPFERLSERTKKVLVFAQDEAERSHSAYVGTEHLLIGLLRETDSTAAKVLTNLGVQLDQVRGTVESVLGRNEAPVVQQIVPTTRTRRVIELAFEEASKKGANLIGTEHLLLAMLIDGEGIAAYVLEDLGVTLDKVATEIDRIHYEAIEQIDREPPATAQSTTPVLDQCGQDLTALAVRSQGRVVSGRETDITRVIEILSQQSRKSVLLIGEFDICRTVIMGVAFKLVSTNVPFVLVGQQLHALDLQALLANARARGQFKQRLELVLREIVDEVRASKKSIVIIDDLHLYLGAGDRAWADVTAEVLTPALTAGDVQCIGSTTPDKFKLFVEPIALVCARFEPIVIPKPTCEEIVEMLQPRREDLERHHRVRIVQESVSRAVTLSDCALNTARALLDRAAAQVRSQRSELPEELKNAQNEIRRLRAAKDDAVARQDYETAASIRDEEKKLTETYISKDLTWRDELGKAIPEVTPSDVDRVAAASGDTLSQGSGGDESRP